MKEGDEFPPIVVFNNEGGYFITDGFHRYEAAIKAGVDTIKSEVREGSYRDAKLYSIEANNKHGLPRTNADKRRAVEMLLRDPEWTKWINREIASRAGCSPAGGEANASPGWKSVSK